MEHGAENYQKYLSGDRNGLTGIVAEYRDGLILYINGIVRDISAAEDIAEDTFLRLIVKKPSFDDRSSFRTWLYGIGRHIAYGRLRKERPERHCQIDDNTADGEELEAAYIKTESNRILHSCLKRLAADKYELIWLSYFENMSAKDISAVTGKSETAVYKALSRARAELKQMLLKEGFSYEDL
jgi:RNA polymerase sigma-70 factor (ECF subfamily)